MKIKAEKDSVREGSPVFMVGVNHGENSFPSHVVDMPHPLHGISDLRG